MKPLRRVGIALTLLATTSCGLSTSGHTERNDSKVNMQQAAEKADAILQETLAAIRPNLRWVHEASEESGCPDWKNSATGGGSVTRGIRVMTIVSPERRGSLLGVVERSWKARGFKITSIDTDAKFPAIYASTPDDFRMDVAVGGEGQFQFTIATPCAADSPVQKPTAPSNVDTNTPAYEGGKPLPRPYLHDEFWSSTAPSEHPSPTADR
ncbi:hypothetical protein [Streptomyces melanogenes]|uniref:hypothetical protein n=1 Tax=Streptomyces melanogenes TaxID=67326 RepID=UPI00167E1309|nr:hypothetical protein [Streptomyces melanogenes]GGP59529.1 hypothetical protein GCM10010278_41000 [Streptomyces melanogenes]